MYLLLHCIDLLGKMRSYLV